MQNLKSKWEIRRISDVAWFQEGPGVRKHQYTNAGIKLLNVRNLVNGNLILDNTQVYISNEEANGKYKHFLVDEGDLIIASSGISVDKFEEKVAFAKKEHLPLCMNTSTIRFKTLDPNILDINFLSYFLKSRYFKEQVQFYITGSAQLNFGPSHLDKMKIFVPPLDEQKHIIKILDKANEIRNNKKLANDKLDELVRSTFIDMFGTPIANEKQWEVKKLKDLSTKIMSGNTPKGGSQVYVSSGIEFYRSQNVWNNRIEKEDIAYIDEETHKKMERSSLKHNDILITKTGRINTENSSLGRSALYEGENDKANINGHVYLVRLKEGINHKFILTILTSKEYREHIRSVCVGGIDKRQLNKEHIEDFPIIYPPIEDQTKFAQIVEKVELQKQKNKQVIEKMDNLFNALSQKAFNGKL